MINACFFPTPDSIVQTIIKNEVKGGYSRVLEPAVGEGALLRALKKPYDRLVAFDINEASLEKVAREVDKDKSDLFCEDFLNVDLAERFDLILSNPPFNNKLKNHLEYEGKRVPIEALFVVKCLGFLESGGKAIFILPSSLVNGDKSKWLRELLVDNYKVLSIYKLPKYSFKKVEGSFYVICVEKTFSRNYDVRLYKSCNLNYILSSEVIKSQCYSLDPEQLSIASRYEQMLNFFGKQMFSNLAVLSRGSLAASDYKRIIYHSTDFKSHVAHPKYVEHSLNSSVVLNKFDVVVKRVGRGSHTSFSLYIGEDGYPCSDCVIKIVPKSKGEMNSLKLLLKIRVAVEMGANSLFHISGSGAGYISMARLRALSLPDSSIFDDQDNLRWYKKLLLSSDYSAALQFEKILAERLCSSIDSPEISAVDQ